jgi:hypothetical protein
MVWAAVPAEAKRRPTCTSFEGTTLYRSGFVRIYRAPRGHRPIKGHAVYGCLTGSRGRLDVVGDADGWVSSGGYAVAFKTYDYVDGMFFGVFTLYDVERGSRVRRFPTPSSTRGCRSNRGLWRVPRRPSIGRRERRPRAPLRRTTHSASLDTRRAGTDGGRAITPGGPCRKPAFSSPGGSECAWPAANAAPRRAPTPKI